jgi:hypothetical protein
LVVRQFIDEQKVRLQVALAMTFPIAAQPVIPELIGQRKIVGKKVHNGRKESLDCRCGAASL